MQKTDNHHRSQLGSDARFRPHVVENRPLGGVSTHGNKFLKTYVQTFAGGLHSVMRVRESCQHLREKTSPPLHVYSQGKRWRSNPSGKCSQERLTRGTVTSTMRKAAHPPGCARCVAGAGCSAIRYQSLGVVPWRSSSQKRSRGEGVNPGLGPCGYFLSQCSGPIFGCSSEIYSQTGQPREDATHVRSARRADSFRRSKGIGGGV